MSAGARRRQRTSPGHVRPLASALLTAAAWAGRSGRAGVGAALLAASLVLALRQAARGELDLDQAPAGNSVEGSSSVTT